MYNFDYMTNPSTTNITSNIIDFGIWGVISAVLAIIGGIAAYFMFLKPDKKTDNKFLTWLKDFANFKTMLIEPLLKVTYIILALFITLASLGLIGKSFVGFILTLTIGNLIIRISYETALIIIMLWKNTNEINKKIKK